MLSVWINQVSFHLLLYLKASWQQETSVLKSQTPLICLNTVTNAMFDNNLIQP